MKLHILAGIFFILAFVLYVAGFKSGANLLFIAFIIETIAWVTLGKAESKNKEK